MQKIQSQVLKQQGQDRMLSLRKRMQKETRCKLSQRQNLKSKSTAPAMQMMNLPTLTTSLPSSQPDRCKRLEHCLRNLSTIPKRQTRVHKQTRALIGVPEQRMQKKRTSSKKKRTSL